MRSYILSLPLFCLTFSLNAQNNGSKEINRTRDVFDDDTFGEGGKREVKTEDWEFTWGKERITTTTYYDPEKHTQSSKTVTTSIETGLTKDSTSETYFDGHLVSKEEYKYSPGGTLYEITKTRYSESGGQMKIIQGTKQSVWKGKVNSTMKLNLKTGRYEDTKTTPESSVDPTITSQSISPKAEFYLGYSYMRAQDGARVLGMPLGANAGLVYNLNSRLGLAVDASYHYKKDGDQKFDREFLLTGIQYRLNGDCCDDDDEPPGIFTHLLIGYARDGFRYMDTKNSEGAFAAAIGGGLNIKLNHKTSLIFKADAKSVFTGTYWPTHLEGGVGLKWDLGSKSQQEKYNKAFEATKN